MGSDAFQVDGVGIGMNCGTLSWCQRIAGGVGTPAPLLELVPGSFQVTVFTL